MSLFPAIMLKLKLKGAPDDFSRKGAKKGKK